MSPSKAAALPKALQEWCDLNSQPITKFKHLCMKPQKFSRGKKINLKTKGVLLRIEELSEPFPDFGEEQNKSETDMLVSKAALKYRPSARIKEISIPIIRYPLELRDILFISRAALVHELSEREAELSQPTKRRNPRSRNFTKVSKAAQNYSASARIEEISKPTKRNTGKKWKYRPPVYVKKAALSATATPRVEEIAKPRPHPDKVTNKHAFHVRKGALEYEATPRTEELAKPRVTTAKYLNPEDKWRHHFDRVDESSEPEAEPTETDKKGQDKKKAQEKKKEQAKTKEQQNKKK